ncbi:hypothetical protein AB0N29_01845 [Nocardioides sp. NPDC092400]|uniref:hypothetical protein n=1 Tax=Nocardioides sp. NPDC092400 TaxID=3155196 RepID=UPI003438A459
MSRKEHRAAQEGMSPRRVTQIFDTAGELLDGGGGGYAQGYQRCGGGEVIVEYGWIEDTNAVGLINKSRGWSSAGQLRHEGRMARGLHQAGRQQLRPGQGGTSRQVNRIFGTRGRVIDRFASGTEEWQIRRYRRCGSEKTRTVAYHRVGHSAWWSYRG